MERQETSSDPKAQALDFRGPAMMAPATRMIHGKFRSKVSHLAEDRLMQEDVAEAREMIREGL